MTHELWTKLNEKMLEYLRGVTLAELVQQQHDRAPGGVAIVQDRRSSRAMPARIPTVVPVL
jgi:Rrf2 family iron-sulfur cluster assembly transcriptional regulator